MSAAGTFRDYHLLLDEQSDAIFATTDQLAERVRKLGGVTLNSIGDIARHQTIKDNDEAYVPPREMLRELMEDNKHMAAAMRKAHKLADDHEDSGTAGLLENLHRRNRAAAPGSCSRPAVRKAATRLGPYVHCIGVGGGAVDAPWPPSPPVRVQVRAALEPHRVASNLHI